MKLLLDTHAFLWAIADPSRLSERARAALTDSSNILVLSTVTLWEIVVKVGLGKLSMPATPQYFASHMDHLGVRSVLPILPAHVYELLKLPDVHKDPFDRLLVAQCRIEKMTLVSADPVLSDYPIRLIW